LHQDLRGDEDDVSQQQHRISHVESVDPVDAEMVIRPATSF